jgi:TolB-like protein/Tfp pilus assembly protein PilF
MGGLNNSEQRQKLQSWKEIAAFLGKDVRTARRWNMERGLPVHRVPGGGSVFAYSDELDAWLNKSSGPESVPETQPGPDVNPGLYPQGAPGNGAGIQASILPEPAIPLETSTSTATPEPEIPLETSLSTSEPSPVRHYARLGILLAVAAVLAVGAYIAGKRLPIGQKPNQAVGQERLMLAVLPFANLSGDPTQQYFSDGLTEELITQMSRLNPRGLGVIARTSVTKYQEGGKDIREAGRELGVDYVLEGSVRRSGKRARITAQLIRVSDQTHLWAESYDEDEGDVLTVEAEVSHAIAGEIQILIAPGAQKTLVNARPINPEAHDAYLRGLYFRDRRGDDDLEKALGYFKQATEKDPQYAEAYAGLASTYVLVGVPRFYEAHAAAEKALSLDPNLALAHAALGVYNLALWNQQESEKEFQRALELDPGLPATHHWHAYNLVVLGRPREAVEEMKRALQLDPLSLPVNRDLGLMLYWSRNYDGAIAQFKKTLEMNPNFHHTHCYLGRAYECQGKFELALAEFERADSNPASISDKQAALGRIYARMGRREEALRTSEELQKISLKSYVLLYNQASIYAALGDKDKAFEYLNKEAQRGRGYLPYLPYDPQFESLRSDPRYPQLVARLKHNP